VRQLPGDGLDPAMGGSIFGHQIYEAHFTSRRTAVWATTPLSYLLVGSLASPPRECLLLRGSKARSPRPNFAPRGTASANSWSLSIDREARATRAV
jgi:hypothetical protein